MPRLQKPSGVPSQAWLKNILLPLAGLPESTRVYKPWTPSELDELCNMRANGMSFASIGLALGRSRSSAADGYRRLEEIRSRKRGPYSTYSPEEDAKLMSLRRLGKAWPSIQEAFPGRSVAALQTRRRAIRPDSLAPMDRNPESTLT